MPCEIVFKIDYTKFYLTVCLAQLKIWMMSLEPLPKTFMKLKSSWLECTKSYRNKKTRGYLSRRAFKSAQKIFTLKQSLINALSQVWR